MGVLNVPEATVNALVDEPKVITANLSWRMVNNSWKLEARVLVVGTTQLLRLTGTCGVRNHSFCLLLNNFPIRRWDMKRRHKNPDNEPISGPHKHRFDEQQGDQWAYKPPDIHAGDVNEDFLAFLSECNIELKGDYQTIAGHHV